MASSSAPSTSNFANESSQRTLTSRLSGLQLALDHRKKKDATAKMTLLDLGVRIQELLARHGVKGEIQYKLTRELVDLIDFYPTELPRKTNFSVFDSSSDESFDDADVADVACQTHNEESTSSEEDQKASELLGKLMSGSEKHRSLETHLTPEKAVEVRRKYLQFKNIHLDDLPFKHYDYNQVMNACCENVIGYMPIPTGIVGPLLLNGEHVYIPMTTTEGALVASTNRGCRVLGSGVTAFVERDGMTRAPVIQFERVEQAYKFKQWLLDAQNFHALKQAFHSTSRFVKLVELTVDIEGNYVHLRFVAQTGDAMGMNMISKAVEAAMNSIDRNIHKFKYISISGNQCADKKASAVNWIRGRGKTVHAEATISQKTVREVLKTSVDEMIDLSKAKLLVGSSTGISIGGWNAHAANIVAAIFLATGQDAAQVVSSSMCITLLDKTSEGDLHVSCSMKCVEVGTVGGGTILSAQRSNLKLLKCAGSNADAPGKNAQRLAQVIAASVLAGELSLIASQCAKDLVKTHLKFNRSNLSLARISEEPKKPEESAASATPKPLERAYKQIAPVNCSSTF